MKGEAPNMSSKEMAQIRQNLEGTPDIEEAAELMNLAGNSTRLKLLYLLENMKELCVCDLAEMLGVSVSAVSQHLAKLKAYGLVAPRRDAQTIYYRLTDHAFNAKLRDNFFKHKAHCKPPQIQQSDGKDRVLGMPTRFGSGFMLPPSLGAGVGSTGFGHPGAGGSLGFADPEADLAFGYVMNQMKLGVTGDERTAALITAVYSSL